MDFTSYTPGDTAKVAIGATTTPSAAVGSGGAKITVRLFATVGACIEFGDEPVATADSFELAAGIPEYVDMLAGQKIAAIRGTGVSTSGVLKITNCSKRAS